MKSFFVQSCLVLALLAIAPELHAQGAAAAMKLGFVNSEEIVQQLPDFKNVEAQLKSAQKTYEDTLRAMQVEFQTRYDAYQKQQSLMNAETKAQEETRLNALRERFAAYQQATLGQGGAYQQLQVQLLQPIKEKVAAAVEKVAKDEKMSAVMETGLTIYYDKKLDITFKVLDYLRRGEK
jgi:outer membrane protein